MKRAPDENGETHKTFGGCDHGLRKSRIASERVVRSRFYRRTGGIDGADSVVARAARGFELVRVQAYLLRGQ